MCGTSGSVIRRSARAHPGERATIKHVPDGVVRFDHNQADRTGLKISAIVARSERGDRRAGKGGQRTIESAHDRANPDFMSRARESVAIPFAFLGVDEARIGLGDVRDLSEPIRLQAGQMDHGLEAILPLLREHNPILTFGREPCLYLVLSAMVARAVPARSRALNSQSRHPTGRSGDKESPRATATYIDRSGPQDIQGSPAGCAVAPVTKAQALTR